ncbi:MAG TPA: hypothetical protein VGI91_01335 [Steroidobacteraceae bacterium]
MSKPVKVKSGRRLMPQFARVRSRRAAAGVRVRMGPVVPLVALLMVTAGWLPTPARAQAVPDAGWQFRAIIYGYLPSFSGTSSFPSDGTSVDVSADQILSSLKFTFMGSLDAQKGSWGAFTDLIYLNLGSSKSGTRDLTVGGIQLPGGITADASLDIKGWLWTVAPKYQVLSDPQRGTVDLFAGARLLDVSEKLAWNFSGNVGPFVGPGRQGSNEQSLSNWDAIAGVKGRLLLGAAHAWFIPYYLDLGTGASDFTGQGILGAGYAFRWGDVIAAWRYLHYDFKSGNAVQNLTLNGPAIGVAFSW